jgi:hypothetical protein
VHSVHETGKSAFLVRLSLFMLLETLFFRQIVVNGLVTIGSPCIMHRIIHFCLDHLSHGRSQLYCSYPEDIQLRIQI